MGPLEIAIIAVVMLIVALWYGRKLTKSSKPLWDTLTANPFRTAAVVVLLLALAMVLAINVVARSGG